MSTSWKSLEEYVRGMAALRWASPCRPEHVDGVDFDGVVRVSDDELVLIEITKERDLDKVRTDLNKIQPTKLRLATQGLICRGFVVLEAQPTPSMKEAGRASHITVCAAEDFAAGYFDFRSYDQLRRHLPFGSAVDSRTGANDSRPFIAVNYIDVVREKHFSFHQIARQLQRAKRVVLTGDYGTGKSRCVREVYQFLCEHIRDSGAYPLAVNLRDHWSSSSALEIIAGHLGNIGFAASVDNAVRLLNSGNLILLLDGFDEIGTQIHDTRIEDRKSLRARAVKGVRDLLARCKAGVLITGRSHYFDGPDEMLQGLGLSTDHEVLCLEVPDVFSVAEADAYLGALGIAAKTPSWLPRKPLVFQTLVELDRGDISSLLGREHGQFEFWGAFIYAVCKRESSGVGGTIAPQTIHLILQRLAAKTRYSQKYYGRLSPSDIDAAYEAVVGSVPDQSGRQLLARMCTLGRIEPESPDRQFLDAGAVDVLRAESLISDIVSMADLDNHANWIQCLRPLGIFHAAQTISTFDLIQQCFAYLRKFGNSGNTVRLGEIVSLLTLFGDEPLDFQALSLDRAALPILNLGARLVSGLALRNSEIDLLVLDQTLIREGDSLVIDGCILSTVAGISSESGLPAWIRDSEVINFERMSNAARIKESVLTPPQKLFLAIVHKIFFQPGSGREEGSLLKGGYGQKYSPKLVDSILRLLIQDGAIERFKGYDGWVYKPVRRYADRMNRIRSELTLSDDQLWKDVSQLR
ncbi:MAG: hypothetical protein AW08_00950 [Candidatus Accumulibacter adjunctus]|mgnify:CR=1 FL=1|uniref:NACHT domain-containing protein n=1 Tax=Candidatus Accumulibacter adjunctus TaxID=1454001 RepID=A0A011MFP3_9PROT|nr:MAG: hypothetical protein AW08_00950 [Candidatus Accumulibacter adjunctus]